MTQPESTNIELKTAEWLTVADLLGQHHVAGAYKKIHDTLKQYQRSMPEYIQYKRCGSRTVLCLHRDGIQMFRTKTQLERPATEIKTEEWLSVGDLIKKRYVVGMYSTILDALEQCQSKMPEYIKPKYNGLRTVLCLHCDAIEMFRDIAKFRHPATENDSGEWLTAGALAKEKDIFGTHTRILRALEKYQFEMPEYIQKKRHGRILVLCLRRDGIPLFIKKSGLNRYEEKTDEWLSAKELAGRYIVGVSNRISDVMTIYQDMNLEYLRPKISGKRPVLCLRRDAIGQFCRLTGLKQKNIDFADMPDKTTKPAQKNVKPESVLDKDEITAMPSLMETLFGVIGDEIINCKTL